MFGDIVDEFDDGVDFCCCLGKSFYLVICVLGLVDCCVGYVCGIMNLLVDFFDGG